MRHQLEDVGGFRRLQLGFTTLSHRKSPASVTRQTSGPSHYRTSTGTGPYCRWHFEAPRVRFSLREHHICRNRCAWIRLESPRKQAPNIAARRSGREARLLSGRASYRERNQIWQIVCLRFLCFGSGCLWAHERVERARLGSTLSHSLMMCGLMGRC